mmetsp:Transcript_32993/g.24293  ORF Transcript_32993/g.24293 Transcript_32993/m.24293 type:complete len:83 (+) Transcript_32993:961-1209(+)
MTMYIIPRKFDLLIENVSFYTSFETLCGFVKCKSEPSYKTLKFDEFNKRMEQAVSLKDSEFEEIKEDLIKKFLSEYQGQRVE